MKSNMKNVERLKSLAEMLTMIFSIGQKMPVTYEGKLRSPFISNRFCPDSVMIPHNPAS